MAVSKSCQPLPRAAKTNSRQRRAQLSDETDNVPKDPTTTDPCREDGPAHTPASNRAREDSRERSHSRGRSAGSQPNRHGETQAGRPAGSQPNRLGEAQPIRYRVQLILWDAVRYNGPPVWAGEGSLRDWSTLPDVVAVCDAMVAHPKIDP